MKQRDLESLITGLLLMGATVPADAVDQNRQQRKQQGKAEQQQSEF
ncbi:MAG: hypothetical protein AABN33_11460 [Acidobacteriota bacterium]